MKKVVIGKNVFIDGGVILNYPSKINFKKFKSKKSTIIGDNAAIRSGSVIYEDVVIGNNVKTGHDVLIREGTFIRSDTDVGTKTVIDGFVTIGRRCSIQTRVYICPYSFVGNNVFIGPNAILTNAKYPTYGVRSASVESDLKGPIIKDYASIGAGAIIIPDITVNEYALVGAGAVVTENVPKYAIVAGSPAKIIGWVCKCGKKLNVTYHEAEPNSVMCECRAVYMLTREDKITRV